MPQNSCYPGLPAQARSRDCVGEPISPTPDEDPGGRPRTPGLEGLPEGGLAELIAKGRAQGSLTTGDVFDALADEDEPSPAQLDAIYNHIRAIGIELVDEIAAELAAEVDDGLASGPAAAATAEAPAISISIPLIVPVPTTEVVSAPEPAAAAAEPAPLAA